MLLKSLVVLCSIFTISYCDSCSFSKNDKNIVDCCKTIFDLETDDKEFNKAGSKCTGSNPNGDYCSLLKCILNYQGLMYADKLNITNIVTATMRGKEETVWGKVVGDTAKTCLTKTAGKECPELSFMDCMDVTLFVNCPKSEWNENETCAQIKKTFSSCV